jgi:hypothetical protein
MCLEHERETGRTESRTDADSIEGQQTRLRMTAMFTHWKSLKHIARISAGFHRCASRDPLSGRADVGKSARTLKNAVRQVHRLQYGGG